MFSLSMSSLPCFPLHCLLLTSRRAYLKVSCYFIYKLSLKILKICKYFSVFLCDCYNISIMHEEEQYREKRKYWFRHILDVAYHIKFLFITVKHLNIVNNKYIFWSRYYGSYFKLHWWGQRANRKPRGMLANNHTIRR